MTALRRHLGQAYIAGDVVARRLLGHRNDGVVERSSRPPDSALAALARRAHDPAEQEALSRIEAGAIVIVTGQQPGLFGGPALTLAKVATALDLRDRLLAAGRSAVAVFWCASEDHDLSEADRLFLPATAKTGVALHRLGLGPPGRPLQDLRLDAQLVARAASMLVDDADSRLLPRLDERFSEWTWRVLRTVFSNRGLLCLEPRDINDSAPFVEARLRLQSELDGVFAAVEERSRAIEAAGFSLQLALPGRDWSLYFKCIEGVRRRAARDRDLTENVTNSAWTRLHAQQLALGASLQVAGPSEIAYIAQVLPLLDACRIAPPQLIGRRTLTVIDAMSRRRGQTLHLDVDAVAREPLLLLPRSAETPPSQRWLRAYVDGACAALRRAGREDLLGTIGRCARTMDAVIARTERRRSRVERSARHRLAEWFLPRGRAQDRVFSVATLAPRRPEAFGHTILAAAAADRDGPLIIDWSEVDVVE